MCTCPIMQTHNCFRAISHPLALSSPPPPPSPSCIEKTPGGHTANLNSGALFGGAIHLAYYRGRDKAPITEIRSPSHDSYNQQCCNHYIICSVVCSIPVQSSHTHLLWDMRQLPSRWVVALPTSTRGEPLLTSLLNEAFSTGTTRQSQSSVSLCPARFVTFFAHKNCLVLSPKFVSIVTQCTAVLQNVQSLAAIFLSRLILLLSHFQPYLPVCMNM